MKVNDVIRAVNMLSSLKTLISRQRLIEEHLLMLDDRIEYDPLSFIRVDYGSDNGPTQTLIFSASVNKNTLRTFLSNALADVKQRTDEIVSDLESLGVDTTEEVLVASVVDLTDLLP